MNEQRIITEYMMTGSELKEELETLIKSGSKIIAVCQVSAFQTLDSMGADVANYIIIFEDHVSSKIKETSKR
jgi:hypothetical protein